MSVLSALVSPDNDAIPFSGTVTNQVFDITNRPISILRADVTGGTLTIETDQRNATIGGIFNGYQEVCKITASTSTVSDWVLVPVGVGGRFRVNLSAGAAHIRIQGVRKQDGTL